MMEAATIALLAPPRAASAEQTLFSIMELDLWSSESRTPTTAIVTKGYIRGWIYWGDEWEKSSPYDRYATGAELVLTNQGASTGALRLTQEHIHVDGRCNKPGFNHRAMHKCMSELGVQSTFFEGPLRGYLEVDKSKTSAVLVGWEAARCPGCEATMDQYVGYDTNIDPPVSRIECKMTTPGNMYFNFDVRRTQLASYGLNKTQSLNIDCRGGDGALIKIQPPRTIQAGPIAAQVDVGAGVAQSKYYKLQKGINYINVTVSAEPTDAEPGRYDGSGVMVVLQE